MPETNTNQQKIDTTLQWNYYVIRELWKLNGYSSSELYKELKTTKRNYTNLVAGGYIPSFLPDRLSKLLNEKTGASKKIFRGEELLNVNGFTFDKIEQYFNDSGEYYSKMQAYKNAYNSKEEKQNLGKATLKSPEKPPHLKKFTDKLKAQLNDIQFKTHDINLFKIWYYFKEGNRLAEGVTIEYIIDDFKKIGIKELESADDKILEDYMNSLKQQYKLTEAVMTYRQNSK